MRFQKRVDVRSAAVLMLPLEKTLIASCSWADERPDPDRAALEDYRQPRSRQAVGDHVTQLERFWLFPVRENDLRAAAWPATWIRKYPQVIELVVAVVADECLYDISTEGGGCHEVQTFHRASYANGCG